MISAWWCVVILMHVQALYALLLMMVHLLSAPLLIVLYVLEGVGWQPSGNYGECSHSMVASWIVGGVLPATGTMANLWLTTYVCVEKLYILRLLQGCLQAFLTTHH